MPLPFLILLILMTLPSGADDKHEFPNGYYDSDTWPIYNLTLSKQGMLEDVFLSGIEPYYFPGMESRFLGFRHARVQVTDCEGNCMPVFHAETGEVAPFTTGKLLKIVFISQPLTLETAEQTIMPWLSKIGRTKEELKVFLKAVKDDPAGYDNRNFGAAPKGFNGGWQGPGGEQWSLYFRKNYSPDIPLRLGFRVNYVQVIPRSEQVKTRYYVLDKILAPEGFVIESNPTKIGPDSSHEFMEAKGIESTFAKLSNKLNDEIKSTSGDSRFSTKPVKPTLDSNEKSTRRKERRPFPFVILGFVLVLVACVVGFIMRALGIRRR